MPTQVEQPEPVLLPDKVSHAYFCLPQKDANEEFLEKRLESFTRTGDEIGTDGRLVPLHHIQRCMECGEERIIPEMEHTAWLQARAQARKATSSTPKAGSLQGTTL